MKSELVYLDEVTESYLNEHGDRPVTLVILRGLIDIARTKMADDQERLEQSMPDPNY